MLEVLVRIDNIFVAGHCMTFRAPVEDSGQTVVPVDPVLKSEQHRFVHHEIFLLEKKPRELSRGFMFPQIRVYLLTFVTTILAYIKVSVTRIMSRYAHKPFQLRPGCRNGP
jgi:hypothetical protein